jgi:hypothetical protein
MAIVCQLWGVPIHVANNMLGHYDLGIGENNGV